MTENENQQSDAVEAGLNVLVVDDSSVARAMIIKTLHMAEVPLEEIYEAGKGQEGLEVIEEHWIDLVLLDINMPVMNGNEMVGRVRDNPGWRDLPIIVVSTDGSRPRIERLQHRGAKYLRKPFTPETLREVVMGILETTNVQ